MKRIVVNGTFDILHPAHIDLLNTAKSLGNYLLVCIDTDSRVKQIKGKNRPIYNQDERKLMLLNLKSVDEVQLFDTDEELETILKQYKPDIMVKGDDWMGKDIVASKYCKEIYWYIRNDDYSTTKTIENIINR
jgi:rfaE bifunctional protein nucleotidyltransferase chain/domain